MVGGADQEFSLGHIQFEVPIKQPSGDNAEAVRHR